MLTAVLKRNGGTIQKTKPGGEGKVLKKKSSLPVKGGTKEPSYCRYTPVQQLIIQRYYCCTHDTRILYVEYVLLYQVPLIATWYDNTHRYRIKCYVVLGLAVLMLTENAHHTSHGSQVALSRFFLLLYCVVSRVPQLFPTI